MQNSCDFLITLGKTIKKRLFIAIPIKPSANFLSAIKKLKINGDKKGWPLKWTPSQNLHITLKFLGECERTDNIKKIMENTCSSFNSLTVHLHGVGAFPHEDKGRVIWAGVKKKRNLMDLQFCLENQFVKEGYLSDQEEYSPHLTLCRLRHFRHLKDFISPFKRKDFGKVTVSHLTLFMSELRGNYPLYTPLEEFPLKTI